MHLAGANAVAGAAAAPASSWQKQGLVALAEQPTVRERLLPLPDEIDLPLAAGMARSKSALLGVGRRDE